MKYKKGDVVGLGYETLGVIKEVVKVENIKTPYWLIENMEEKHRPEGMHFHTVNTKKIFER